MLYPQESETREVKDLSGIWNFKVGQNQDKNLEWYKQPLDEPDLMPVPASYNDITQDANLRDHIGDVWYEKMFFVPPSWKDKNVLLRFGSVCHNSIVWVNGEKVIENKGGFLPFEADINNYVEFDKENRITVCVNNVLTWKTLPTGEVRTFDDSDLHPKGHIIQDYHFDFFNYAGIHRPVKLIALPKTFIRGIVRILIYVTISYSLGCEAPGVLVFAGHPVAVGVRIIVSVYDVTAVITGRMDKLLDKIAIGIFAEKFVGKAVIRIVHIFVDYNIINILYIL